MKAPLYILFGALLVVVTATSLGAVLLRALGIQLCRLEERLLAFITGSACLSAIVTLLCALHLARKGVFLGVAAIAAGFALRAGIHRAPAGRLPPVPALWKWLFGIAFTTFTVLYFFNAMAPETSADGSAYHLPIVSAYYRAHGFVRNTANLYANISQGVEMLFLFAFSFGKYSAATLVHFSFLAVLPWLMLCYARRFGITIAGSAAAILVYASPVVGMDGSNAYVDVALAAVLFALFYLLQIWTESKNNRVLIPIGILTGFAFATKITAIVALPYVAGVVLWTLWRERKPVVRPLAAVVALALLFILPWTIKSWVWVGNPLAPFANLVFPNPNIHPSFESDYRRYQQIYTLTSLKQIPYELTIKGGLLCGFFGPFFLLTPLCLLALRSPLGRQLLLAGAVFGAVYYTNIGTRFLIPALPFVSLALATVLVRIPPLLLVLVVAHAAASWPSAAVLYCSPYAWRLNDIPVRAALRIEPENVYLNRTFSGYQMDRMLEQKVPPDGKIFSMGQISESYMTRKVLVKFLSAPNEVLADILLTPLYIDFQPRRILTFRFPGRSARKVRIVQTANTRDSLWSVAELRIYDSGKELARAPQWRLTANPNPWDVQLAFDNDPVTRWQTWQIAKPGMNIAVDFGSVQKLDSVVVETAPQWSDPVVRLEAPDENGKWAPVGGAPSNTERPITVSLRRAATQEFKSRGVRYLLIGYDDLGSADFHMHSAAWGIKEIGDAGYGRLYYIE